MIYHEDDEDVDDHHQPVLLSLTIMNYHEDDEDVDESDILQSSHNQTSSGPRVDGR